MRRFIQAILINVSSRYRKKAITNLESMIEECTENIIALEDTINYYKVQKEFYKLIGSKNEVSLFDKAILEANEEKDRIECAFKEIDKAICIIHNIENN